MVQILLIVALMHMHAHGYAHYGGLEGNYHVHCCVDSCVEDEHDHGYAKERYEGAGCDALDGTAVADGYRGYSHGPMPRLVKKNVRPT
jgi:hypothetical protein